MAGHSAQVHPPVFHVFTKSRHYYSSAGGVVTEEDRVMNQAIQGFHYVWRTAIQESDKPLISLMGQPDDNRRSRSNRTVHFYVSLMQETIF